MMIEKYLARVSGPLIDRIDIHIEVPAVPYDELRGRRDGTSSSTIRESVFRAREKQLQRFGDPTMCNSRMSGRLLRDHCMLDSRCEALLRQAIAELGLSARAHDKVLRIARTIADIADHSSILPEDMMEAIHYRRLDRKL